MDAVVYRQGDVVLEIIADPVPAASEVRVRVLASGVCDTDERFRSFKFLPDGAIMGHSAAGRVDAVGASVTKVRTGDMVAVHFVAGCGDCEACRRGEDNLCPKAQLIGLTRPGGLANYICVPESCALPFSPRIAAAEAALLPCGYGTPFRAIRQAKVAAGENVLLLGSRLWALTSIEMCHLLGAKAAVADTDPERLAHASAVGADAVLRWPEVKGAFDVMLDFTGEIELIGPALGMLRPGGRAVIVGRAGPMGNLALELPALVMRELTVTGGWLVRRSELAELVDWLSAGKLRPAQFLSHRATLAEASEAFSMMRELNPRSVMLDL